MKRNKAFKVTVWGLAEFNRICETPESLHEGIKGEGIYIVDNEAEMKVGREFYHIYTVYVRYSAKSNLQIAENVPSRYIGQIITGELAVADMDFLWKED